MSHHTQAACVPCKIIINEVVMALTRAVERIMLDQSTRAVALTAAECDVYLDRLRALDIQAVTGKTANDSLTAILLDMEEAGIIDADVWEVLKRPARKASR